MLGLALINMGRQPIDGKVFLTDSTNHKVLADSPNSDVKLFLKFLKLTRSLVTHLYYSIRKNDDLNLIYSILLQKIK